MDRGDSSAVPDDVVLIALGTPGQSLTVRLTGPTAPKAIIATERAWRNARIEIDAAPFSGVIQTVLTSSDLEQYRAAMESLAATGHAVIGGDRGPRIELNRDGSVIEVSVSPSGDDPWPIIRYLVFPLS